MPRHKPNSLKDGKKTNLKSSFNALIYIPRFFKEIWKVNKSLFLLSAFCRLIGALLPVIILWVGKLIIDEIILQISLDSPDYYTLWTYVAAEFGLIILSDLISRAISLTDGLLGDEYNIASSVTIIKKTNQINISLLEDSEFYDKLERARTQTTGRVGLMSNVLGQAQSAISIATLVAGLIYFEPYLIILLVLSIIPSFINEIRFSQQQYSLARSWTSERRELDYLRFKNLSEEYYQLNKTLAIRRSSLGFFV
jgi:ATP-binding cassette, subfamily B, bacterial